MLATVWMLAAYGDQRDLGHAQDALDRGLPTDARALANSTSGQTVDGAAARLAAAAALEQGDLPGAIRESRRALRLSPNDWSAYRDLAVLLNRADDRPAARAAMARALALNPRLDLPPGFARPLPGRHRG